MQDGEEIQETSVGRETTTNNLTNTSKTLDNQQKVNTEDIAEDQQVQASNVTLHAGEERKEKEEDQND